MQTEVSPSCGDAGDDGADAKVAPAAEPTTQTHVSDDAKTNLEQEVPLSKTSQERPQQDVLSQLIDDTLNCNLTDQPIQPVTCDPVRPATETQANIALFKVECSLCVFRVWWLFIVLVHCVCGVYFAFLAYVYRYIEYQSATNSIIRYAAKQQLPDFIWSSNVFGALAAPHLFCVLKILLQSLIYRSFLLQLPSVSGRTRTFSTGRRLSAFASRHISSRLKNDVSEKLHASTVYRAVLRWGEKIFGDRGLLGVQGEHFHIVFTLQETLDVALQSAQAYRMSLWLSRLWLHHAYVSVLIINCWSTTLIQRLFGRHPPLERLLVFVVSMVTDVIAMIVVPAALVQPYVTNWIAQSGNYVVYRYYWYDDAWLVTALNEAKIVMVTSMYDLIGKVLFTASLLSTMSILKTIVVPRRSRSRQSSSSRRTGSVSASDRLKRSSQFVWSAIKIATAETSAGKRRLSLRSLNTKHRFLAVMQSLFVVWGVIILVAQTHADSRPALDQCRLQVRPWFESKPSCSLLEINCYHDAISGSHDEIAAVLDAVNAPYVINAVFRHCPSIEFPTGIQRLRYLFGFKVHNSTIARWPLDAALTNAHHPRITFLFAINVNLSGIPDGLLSTNFPKRLTDIEFAQSNLSSLPTNLDSIWPRGMVLVLEKARFTEVPAVLLRMHIAYLGFGENRVTQVPAELFTNSLARTIWLSGNPIAALPSDLAGGSLPKSLYRIRLVGTKVALNASGLPPWMRDVYLQRTGNTMYAGRTPLCTRLAAAKKANEDLDALFNATASVIVPRISCAPATGDNMTYYPHEFESKFNVV